MPATVGHKMKFYRNGGTHAAPAWVEIAEIGDLSIPDLAMGMAELKRRANDWTKNLATLMQSFGVEFRLIHGLGASMFTLLQTDFFAGTAREYAVMNGAIATTGSQGLRLQAHLEQFPWDQNLEDVSGHDVVLKVAYMEESGSELDPDWYTVP